MNNETNYDGFLTLLWLSAYVLLPDFRKCCKKNCTQLILYEKNILIFDSERPQKITASFQVRVRNIKMSKILTRYTNNPTKADTIH